MKIVFMGTPDFAKEPLKAILDSHHELKLVITQPDRQRGRGKKIEESPVKKIAIEHKIPLLQPQNINCPEVIQQLKEIDADIFVVVAFGQILKEELLCLPCFGAINIHASLLPTLRGAAPIQRAIMEGHKETGITIMQMDKGLDTGDMLLKSNMSISETMTYSQLHDRLRDSAGTLLLEALEKIENGTIQREEQNSDQATYAKMIFSETGQIDFQKTAQEISCLIRGVDPKPGAYFYYQGNKCKVFSPKVFPEETEEIPGTVLKMTAQGIFIACGEKSILQVTEIQMPGKKRMDVKSYILGNGTWNQVVLGE